MEQDDVRGVWLLTGFHTQNVDTGVRAEPFGPAPRGTLILHEGGRMVALITPSERTAPSSEADQATAFQKLIAYSGPYRLETPDRLVTSVDIAWLEPWIGTDQARTIRVADGTLEIVTPPGRMPRGDGGFDTVVGVLSWRRERAVSAI